MTPSPKKTRLSLIVGRPAVATTAIVGTSALFFNDSANAQSASSSITQMNTDATAIGTLIGVLQPIAVGAVVFGAAALLFKRYLYS
jgi:hypothetical protein